MIYYIALYPYQCSNQQTFKSSSDTVILVFTTLAVSQAKVKLV